MKSRFWKLGLLALGTVVFTPVLLAQAPGQNSAPPSAEVSLQIIVVSSESEALGVLNRIEKGEDFSLLAKTHSIDSTAESGGNLGSVDPSKLRTEFRTALAGLRPGGIARPFRSPLGYVILKLLTYATASGAGGGTPSTDATGSVKYALNVSGQNEAQIPLREISKDSIWDPTPQAVCEVMRGYAQKQALERFLAPGDEKLLASQGELNLIDAHTSLGEINVYIGNMESAIGQYEQAQRLADSHNPGMALQLNEILGIAYLHKSEMGNDVYRKPGNRCLLPMMKSNRFLRPQDSRKAVEYFLKYLAQKPEELEVKWLLNFAYMTLGEYPESVPRQYLIPPTAFESAEAAPRFRDVAPEAGLDTFSMAGGIIVDDFQNDGRLDIVKSSFDTCAPMLYFRNNGDGTFSDQSAKAGLDGQLGGLNIGQTDYNNDGCLDILVMRGGWEAAQHRSLLRNNCDGTFTDVTKTSGLSAVATSSQTAVWVDINNDGLLDLFVGNENRAAQLFLNQGNGVFKNISHSAGIDRVAFSKGVAAGDYNNDGWPDLFVSNLTGRNFLYHNNHDNTFTEVAEPAGVAGPVRGFPTWFFDYDNDGWPDLFVASYFYSVDDVARTYVGLSHNAISLKLYRNLGNGKFRDVTTEVGLDKVFMPMGANFGDIDNDGFLDIYLGTGAPTYAALGPNVLLRNNEGKSFVDVSATTGTGDWHKGHGVAFADLTNRGVEDIVEEMGGATPGDSHAMRVFENPGSSNDWISLKLVGVKTNRAAIGARIKVTAENDGGAARSIYRTVGSGGSFGASPLQQHVGLGKRAQIKDIEIWWPASSTRQHFADIEKNQFVEVTEFSQKWIRLERKPYRLGGANRMPATEHTGPTSTPRN